MNQSFRILFLLVIVALFAIIGLAPLTASAQTPQGAILRVQPDKTSYLPASGRVTISILVENPTVQSQTYGFQIEIRGPSGARVAQGSVNNVIVGGNSERSVDYVWEGLNTQSEAGEYAVDVTLVDWNDIDNVLDTEPANFSVQELAFLNISTRSIDFGSFQPGETPERSFVVNNAGNGNLEWQVTFFPEHWMEVVRPLGVVTGQETVVMRVKADAKLSTALQGVVRIASNAGDAEIAVRANVTGAISGRMRSIEILGINHKQGDPIEIVFNVQNSGNIPLTYRSNVVVQGPDGNIVFQTKDIDDEVILSLAAGANENFTYFWDAPLDAPIGRYLITASLRYVHDEDILFHDYFDNRFIESRDQPLVFTYLDLREGPLLRVEPLEHDFGILQPGQTPTAELTVSNARQATLTWSVTDVPDWITVLSPAPGVSNASGGSVRFRVNDAIAPGNYDDDLVIESSGGTERIRLTAQIPEPTATPSPTGTPEPTATPALPTVTPEPTQQPATATATTMPTATSVPATSTPAPTATPVPATPTATPAPPTATATTMPTATAAAAAEVEEDEGAEEESGGGCGAPTGHVPAGAAAANLLFLLGPAGLAAFVKMRRR